MGSPLGLTLANAFLCHYEKERLNNCPIHFKPVIYKRYLHDVLFSFKEHLQLFVDYMKKKHKCRKLTSEAENDKFFLFLGIKITVITNNFKHMFLKKQLLVVYLHSMKVICIKHKRSP